MTEPSERDVAAILARGLIRVREQARRTGAKRRPSVPGVQEQPGAQRTSLECQTPSSSKGDSL